MDSRSEEEDRTTKTDVDKISGKKTERLAGPGTRSNDGQLISNMGMHW